MIVKFLRERRGSLLINSIILMVVLLLTGAAFLKWTADEAYQARFDLARTQAYYIAQLGVINTGLSALRQYTDVELPVTQQTFAPSGDIANEDPDLGFHAQYVNNVLDPKIKAVDPSTPDLANASPDEYTISSTGVVYVTDENGQSRPIKRMVSIRVQKPPLSKYFYFTNHELTEFGEIIWFYQQDVVYGPVRSNEAIGIKNNPTFYSEVITTAPDFIQGPGFDPQFLGPEPQFNADTVVFSIGRMMKDRKRPSFAMPPRRTATTFRTTTANSTLVSKRV